MRDWKDEVALKEAMFLRLFQGLHIRTSCSSTQQNPESWPFHTRSWCIFQCETETWCVVQHTQSKSCPSPCISKILHWAICPAKKPMNCDIAPMSEKKDSLRMVAMGQREKQIPGNQWWQSTEGTICVRRSSASSLAALGILRELTVSKAAEIPGRTLQKATKTVE